MSLFDHRFVLFSGKGGVGKTTVSSAFALSCARRGQRTLLIQLDVKEKVSSFFGSRKVSTEIIEVEDNLFAVNITPRAALEEYGLMVLKVKLIYKAVFENRIVRSFLRSVPGLNDLLMLGKSHFHATEQNADGSYVWDKVVVDAPATGHGIFFLQIPSVITSILSSGHMYEEAKKIEEFLQNSELTSLNLVTLPEEMPVNETLMLRDVIREKLGISVFSIVANSVYEPLFEPSEVEWMNQALDDVEEDDPLHGLLDGASFRNQRVELQQRYLDRLDQETEAPILHLPYYFVERVTFPVIRDMAKRLDAQMSGNSTSQE
ncbi:MAG: ArsA family ATPase [Myxococcota bacterium]